MKVYVCVTVLLAIVALVYTQEECMQEVNCVLADNCVCPNYVPPINVPHVPQFITISFNEALNDMYYQLYYKPLLSNRKNPDGGGVSATFYVPHEYNDYIVVNSLYNAGHEIASHSITKNPISDYWLLANVETLVAEFKGQMKIISRFANIPEDAITGARVPNFELAGDRLFQAYAQAGIEYDTTWTIKHGEQFFPFTLDFITGRYGNRYVYCNIGICPDESHPGMWVAPNNPLIGDEGIECNNLQACRITGSAQEISDWLLTQFLKLYNANRTPMNLIASAAWFAVTPNALEGFASFLDRLQEYDDVFLVSHKQVIDWMKNPVPATEYSSVVSPRNQNCLRRSCTLEKDEEIRYMGSCIMCPKVFPWLGNVYGELQ